MKKLNLFFKMILAHPSKSVFSLQQTETSWMDYMNAYFVHAAQLAALLFGGTQINLLDQLLYYKHIDFLQIQEI
jgi:hypothetical protein